MSRESGATNSKEQILTDFFDFIQNKLSTVVQIPKIDESAIKSAVQTYIINVLQGLDLPKLIHSAIKEATQDLQVTNAIVTDVPVTNAIIKDVPVSREVLKVEEKVKVLEKPYEVPIPQLNLEALRDTVGSVVLDILKGLKLPEQFKEAIAKATEDVHIKNAVVQDEIIHREIIEPIPIKKDFIEPVIREQVMNVLKVVLPDGRVIE